MNSLNLFNFLKKKNTPKHLYVGAFGEKKAASLLKRSGYRIIARNFCKYKKEIDIIAENKDFIVFCEVKSRITNEFLMKKYGRPLDAVNYYKRKNIISGAKIFLSSYKTEKQVRFDIIEVFLSENKKRLKVEDINHVKDAFRV